MNQVNLYFTIKGDSIIQYTDRNRNEVFMNAKVGSVKVKNSIKTKYEVDKNCVTDYISGVCIKEWAIDTFTNKSYQVVYELKEQ